MSNPLEIEKRYKTLQSLLPLISSGKLRISKIAEFLEMLSEEKNDIYLFAYCSGLLQQLNNNLSAIGAEGINPAFFKKILQLIKSIELRCSHDEELDFKRAYELLNNKVTDIESILKAKSSDAKPFDEGLPDAVKVPLVEKENLLPSDPHCAAISQLTISIKKDVRDDSLNLLNRKIEMRDEKNISPGLIKKIISDIFSIRIKSHYKIDYRVLGNVSLTGDSLNAGLASLLVCGLLNNSQYKEKYFLSSLAAITGSVDENGAVTNVDEEGLKLKTEACFFSNVKYFVVPKEQAAVAENKAAELKKVYPDGLLTIIPCSEVKDLIFDRRIILIQRINPAKRAYNYAGRNKLKFLSAAVVILLIVLLKIAYGPIDRNPVSGVFKGEYLFIKNKYNEQITEIKIGKNTAEFRSANQVVSFYDVDNDGINEVFCADNDSADIFSTIYCRSLSDDKILWKYQVKKKLNFPNNPVEDVNFRCSLMKVGDYDNDGIPEMYILANGGLYPGLLIKLNAKSGRELSSYVNIGQFISMDFVDLNNDGKEEILLVGIHNALRSACIAVLDPANINGYSPLTEKYKIEGYPEGKEMYYILIPPTIVGQVYKDKSKWNSACVESVNEKEKVLRISISDVNLTLSYQPTFYIYFNFRMQPLYVSTGDAYDMLSEKLKKEGKIPFIPDQKYFKEYMKTLKYWDGKKWVNKPAENIKYTQITTSKK